MKHIKGRKVGEGCMHKYDTLKDTWIYQEIKQQIQEEEHQHRLVEQRQTLLQIVQARFPRIESLAKKAIANITEPAILQDLIVKISIARAEKEARQRFTEVTTANNEGT
jgi:predicted transposase YdaD